MAKRKKVPIDVQRLVLHEAGYLCGNPSCRTIITLDIHHIVQVSDDGPNEPQNLLALCPNCHALHHRGEIPIESIRAWKMLLLALNEAFDRRSIDILLALDAVGPVETSGDTVFAYCAGLIAAGYIQFRAFGHICTYTMTNKGRQLVEAWKAGDQDLAIRQLVQVDSATDSGARADQAASS